MSTGLLGRRGESHSLVTRGTGQYTAGRGRRASLQTGMLAEKESKPRKTKWSNSRFCVLRFLGLSFLHATRSLSSCKLSPSAHRVTTSPLPLRHPASFKRVEQARNRTFSKLCPKTIPNEQALEHRHLVHHGRENRCPNFQPAATLGRPSKPISVRTQKLTLRRSTGTLSNRSSSPRSSRCSDELDPEEVSLKFELSSWTTNPDRSFLPPYPLSPCSRSVATTGLCETLKASFVQNGATRSEILTNIENRTYPRERHPCSARV